MTEETTLADLRVLDLSSGMAGALCGRYFADYGADVIAISPPGEVPPLCEGKRSVTLDISKPAGRELLGALVEKANIVIETFPEGTLESLGLGFARLEAIKRRIVVVSAPDGSDEAASRFAGLAAFAAAALAAFNADSHEIPQHMRVAAEGCVAAVQGSPGGLPADAPFAMSTVERARGEAPAAGEHNAEVFAEIGVPAEELARLRDEGAL